MSLNKIKNTHPSRDECKPRGTTLVPAGGRAPRSGAAGVGSDPCAWGNGGRVRFAYWQGAPGRLAFAFRSQLRKDFRPGGQPRLAPCPGSLADCAGRTRFHRRFYGTDCGVLCHKVGRRGRGLKRHPRRTLREDLFDEGTKERIGIQAVLTPSQKWLGRTERVVRSSMPLPLGLTGAAATMLGWTKHRLGAWPYLLR